MWSILFPQSVRLQGHQPRFWLWLLLLLAILFYFWQPPAVYAASSAAPDQACTVALELLAAPYAIVDSNKPGAQGPQLFVIGVRVKNNGNASLDELTLAIGDGSTPGRFTAVSGAQLALLPNERASKLLGELAPGASTVVYWTLTYPLTTNTAYTYTVWPTDQGCTERGQGTVTPQAILSTSSNKLASSGSTLLVAPRKVAPGGTVTVRATGFTLGTIGKGPSNQYDAWLQPIGNLGFDPSCMELIQSKVYLESVSATPFVDQLYFTNLKNYKKDSDDYVEYTFLARRACTTDLLLYQQAASGTQWKYNSDYRSSTLTLVSEAQATLAIELASDKQNVQAGDTIQLQAKITTTKGEIGHPGCGAPLVIIAEVPQQATFVPGSAAIDVGAKLQYSTDGGNSWQNSPPTGSPVTHLRWRLRKALDTDGTTIGYKLTFTGAVGNTPLSAKISAGLMNSETIAQATVVMNGATPTPTPTPTATPDPGVGGGGEGGLESGPLPGAPSAFLGGIGNGPGAQGANAGAVNAAQQKWHKARLLRQMSFQLDDFMPAQGPVNTTPKPAVPVDVLAVTNAPDAKAVDFVDAQGKIEAVVLGILSVGAPYEHDYAVCNRFKGYTLEGATPQAIPLPTGSTGWFWHASATQGTAIREETLLFHLFVDEAKQQFHLDSRWTGDSYPPSLDFTFDYVMNMQVWSNDLATSVALVSRILEQIQAMSNQGWQVIYHNQSAPATPKLFVQQATYATNGVTLALQNQTDHSLPVRIHGSWRSHLDRLTLISVDYTVELPAGQTDLRVGLPDLLDATLYVESDGFTDKIYSGGGLWFEVQPTEGPVTTLNLGECRNIDEVDSSDLLLAGCADVTHPGYPQADSVGIGRTLNPNGMPVDVSPYGALRFWAKGNGTPVRILLESTEISDGDYYQVVFTPPAEWRQYIIPLREFSQRGFGTPQSFTGTQLKAVLWVNADTSGRPFALQVDQVSFTNSGLLTATTLAQSNQDTNARMVQFSAPTAAGIANLVLYYSVDGGRTYQSMPAVLARTEGSNQIFQGQLPGQGLGSEVRYYVEASHANGYLSRMPLDAPQNFYRYRVDDRALRLIDDFGGERLYNRLGAPSGIFNAEPAGGQLLAYTVDQQLLLDYNVAAAGQFAGYYTELGNLDASNYTTVDLLVRGETGGEQLLVGLRDSKGYEPRLSVGDFLPGGITTEWRWVQIGLSHFGPTLDRTTLASLSLTFDNGYAPTSGRIYVRELRLTGLPAATVIDHFDDQNLQMNGQGLGYWSSAPGGSLVATPVAGDARQASGAALQLDYTVATGGYAIWHSDLRPFTSGDAASGLLTLWVKGAAQPVPPQIYLTDGTIRAKVALTDLVTFDNSWQLVQVELSRFTAQGLNLAALTGFETVFELGSGSGQLWIDNVTLGTAGAPQVDQRILHLQDRDQQIVALHLPSGSRWQATSDVPWLTASGAGAGAETLRINSEPGALAVGSYTGHLTIDSGTAPVEVITVTLQVTQPGIVSHRLFLPVVTR